jgi:hypothetical protein
MKLLEIKQSIELLNKLNKKNLVSSKIIDDLTSQLYLRIAFLKPELNPNLEQ